MQSSVFTAVFTLMLSAIPTFVAITSFATFVLMDPVNNILTAEVAFVSLSYFNIIRIPLVSFPYVIVQLIQTQVSISRINNFLRSSEANAAHVGRKIDPKYAIRMTNASFTWNKSSAAVVKDITLKFLSKR